MFTGIVEETGVINQIEQKKNLCVLIVKAVKAIRGAKVGDSISVNGICLTVTKKSASTMQFDLMLETLQKTSFKSLKKGARVNLERALKVGDRLGGHFVSGHVDGVGIIKKIKTMDNYVEFRLTTPKGLRKFLAPKGCVCIDGVSLTIGEVKKDYFSVFMIPHTLKVTTFGKYKIGQKVNIETDLLAKYVLSAKG